MPNLLRCSAHSFRIVYMFLGSVINRSYDSSHLQSSNLQSLRLLVHCTMASRPRLAFSLSTHGKHVLYVYQLTNQGGPPARSASGRKENNGLPKPVGPSYNPTLDATISNIEDKLSSIASTNFPTYASNYQETESTTPHATASPRIRSQQDNLTGSAYLKRAMDTSSRLVLVQHVDVVCGGIQCTSLRSSPSAARCPLPVALRPSLLSVENSVFFCGHLRQLVKTPPFHASTER